MNTKPLRILVVDDDAAMREVICETIENNGDNGVCVENAEKAIDSLRESRFDVVITDVEMPGMDGLELADYIRMKYPQMIIIVSSGSSDPRIEREVAKLGLMFFQKPASLSFMMKTIKEISKNKNSN